MNLIFDIKLSLTITLLTSIIIASQLHPSEKSPRNLHIGGPSVLSIVQTKPHFPRLKRYLPLVPDETTTYLANKKVDALQLITSSFAAAQEYPLSSPSVMRNLTSVSAIFSVSEIHYNFSSRTPDGVFVQDISVSIDKGLLSWRCGINYRLQRVEGKTQTGLGAVSAGDFEGGKFVSREDFAVNAGQTVMASINSQQSSNQTVTNCYLKNMDSNQQYNSTSRLTESSESYQSPILWDHIHWGVIQQATPGLPTPTFQNISFWDLKSGTDNGMMTSPRNRTDIVSTFKERPQIGLVDDNATAFHVYWQENTFTTGIKTTNTT
ncbi:hypothetical protein GLAREA_12111 [Glarea lozoyensis ATCC 20868]|uniref:Uncharacterized protein n=1 Tax=Glarea lozoyensis (strain ATCC 20868 / MF5171) TaxID=1116229 RepID=S3D4I8_GLAL2|nr:uncharacterized protein GLAREA_12111 [Glarea lozoyensis ATCC 20868]EPE32029.1 hypothetical protein GLAREA_12111 [Glarea lozoyensis ATCC 20868]